MTGPAPVEALGASVRSAFCRPSYTTTGRDHGLRALLPPVGATRGRWENELRPALLGEWRRRLGRPSFGHAPGVRALGQWVGDGVVATLWAQATDPGREQRVLLLRPTAPASSPMPCAVVPYYDVERPAGFAVDRTRSGVLTPDRSLRETATLGLHLARQGLLVACVEAFPFNTVPPPSPEALAEDGFAWWRSAASRLREDHPEWTGLGRLVRDTSLALDFLLAQPDADASRVLAMGHSLGGKMAFFTGALDARVTAVIGSDFGLPWRSTNWEAPWYLGDRVPPDDHGAALHEVLALLAPRPFFLIAGEADARESWQYLQAAQPVYSLLGANADGLPGGIDHGAGHAPSVAALEVAYAWLREHFRLGHRPWRA